MSSFDTKMTTWFDSTTKDSSTIDEVPSLEDWSTTDEVPSWERNKKKRMKNKLNKKNRLFKPGCSFFYMFASIDSPDACYILYKLTFEQLNNQQLSLSKKMHSPANLRTKPSANLNKKKHLESSFLSPCLVFHPRDFPAHYCSLIQLGDYFYFVGQKPSDFYRIAKFRIENLIPNQTYPASIFLQPVKALMKSPKRAPLVFVAKNNLYVISRDYSFSYYDFEMYSPTRNSWKVLKHRPLGNIGDLKSYIVLDHTVYFATSPAESGGHDESVLSYHLDYGFWTVLSTSPIQNSFHLLHPAFDPPVVLIGSMLFGGFQKNCSVVASPDSQLSDLTKPMFMRPSLAPGPHFWREFCLRRKYVFNVTTSHYMTDLQTRDGRDVLCYVSYGNCPYSDDPMAFFSFFRIPDTSTLRKMSRPNELVETWRKKEPVDDYALAYSKQHLHKTFGIDSYFDSEFMHHKLFKLPTDKPRGRLITCFSC